MIRQLICLAVVVLFHLGVLTPAPAYASVSYVINVDTSSISSQSGYLDFQFNPAGTDTPSANVLVAGFSSVGGILSQPAGLTGDASGSLPGTLTFDNGTGYNDAFQGFTFGSSFSFVVTLSGTPFDNPGSGENAGESTASAFAVSLYASDMMTPLLTTDSNGSIATINLYSNGMTTVDTFSPSGNLPPVATADLVPEPSTLALVVIAIPCAGLMYLRRRRREKPQMARAFVAPTS